MSEKYNGWANYYTWATHLWMTSDEQEYKCWRDEARGALSQHNGHINNAIHDLSHAMEKAITEDFFQATTVDALANIGLVRDCLSRARQEIDFDEIAAAFVQEAVEEGQKK